MPVLLAACSPSLSSEGAVVSSPGATREPPPTADGLLSPTALDLPGACSVSAVAERMDALAHDVSRGDGTAVAAHFLAGANLRWEVREHFDPPNGTLGALRTPAAISAFTEILHERGEVWATAQVVPPARHVEGSPAVYGARITAIAPGATLSSSVKVVIDCETGRVMHMVGPST